MNKALLLAAVLSFLPGLDTRADVPARLTERALASPPTPTTLHFEVTAAPGLLSAPQDGRILVVMSPNGRPEPRLTIGQTGLTTPPVLGRDADHFSAGAVVVLDQTCVAFPIEHLSQLPPGDYHVQAVFDSNRDLKSPGSPGNLYSAVQKVKLDPAQGGTVHLQLTRQVPAEHLLADTESVKYLKLPSKLLSAFHGRAMYLRAGVILPRDFEREPDRHYPLRVHIGGYGSRFTNVGRLMSSGSDFHNAWQDKDTPPMILLYLDGSGPFGDPYQVNSANNGPYGDAVTQELIPYVEQKYRGIGQPRARFLDGASTGGWVSLALQIFYPDFFNGAWSHCPDPVDFRAFELINIYQHDNAYINTFGFERPSMRSTDGETRFTLRHECRIELVLGRGDRWPLSGKDWGAWNAVFGPRGSDGLPRALWDGRTGKIDRTVLDHWRQYDLRRVLEQNWTTLGPRLRGKIHIWVGDADDYFLNNAVHLLDRFLQQAKPPYEGTITYAPGGGHTLGAITEREQTQAMAARAR